MSIIVWCNLVSDSCLEGYSLGWSMHRKYLLYKGLHGCQNEIARGFSDKIIYKHDFGDEPFAIILPSELN